MAVILALDSSTDACSVALYANGELSSSFELAAKSHTQRLLPMVDELLAGHGIGLTDLDAIAFGRGPGSFTGLRICIGIVQGLAFGANLPVIPVSTLEAMALGFYRNNPTSKQPVMVALDARMNEIYWCAYQPTGQAAGLLEPMVDEVVINPELLVEQVLPVIPGGFAAVGPGWHYPSLQKLAPQSLILDVHPSAEDMALIAARLWQEGAAINVLEAEPVYLRDTVSWQKRQRIRDTHDLLVK
ncbi:tRNA (adenosine(37)-N6)-threonylcarbamoyltransferase complex dimerization subunit type 1 TsaB [Cellvibrio fontiphilus]|jgi:tRNA threonylcarbamoyladenosine biosynthesis protein TsaB|uniref:tRNA threonylcarbamoyladenosine biosynthesis protein TsaB n=1 Tax=Cellvibrio fontiphilus TaxID=1815559 RepID=A0ABV7FGF3_9GAMM